MTSDDGMEWLWSYREQLWLFDRQDAFWISQAKKGWDDDEERLKFLVSYGLKRGKSGSFLLNRGNEIWQQLARIYRKPVHEGDTATINKRWRQANSLVHELSKEHSKNHSGYQFHSFTLKLYWFYQPHALTMYDTYSHKALHRMMRKRSGEKVTPDNYLKAFDELYRQHKKQITQLCSKNGRVYKYPRRVLDKWLWLQGSGRKDEMMKRFRAAMEPARAHSK